MYRRFFKRSLDIVLAAVAIVVVLPFMLPIIIGLLLTGEHYVFYFQERIGYRNRPFKIWKFATMLKNSPNLPGGMHTTRNDPRVLPMGGFLRKTKINEIPQLVNILKGDMSFVGPRPLVQKTFDPYPAHVREKIYNVRPGLTGIGSIVFRDEERLLSETSIDPKEYYAKYIAPYKGELEIWYQNHLTFRTDFMLIFLTVWVIFSPRSELVHKYFSDLPSRPEFLD
ncbi:MAG: sugar transferase [Bacteroidales bacterium]|nr:sugar transferase [Bacteroidales bacterium]